MKMPSLIDRVSRDATLNITFVGMTIALIFLAWLGVAYMHGSLNALERNIVKRQTMLERAKDFQASSIRIKEQLKSVKSELSDLQAKLPENPEESQFLRELSERASATGVSLSDFRPGGVSQRPHCKDIELRLRGTGSYASICRWLDRLRDVPRIMRISHVTISGPSAADADCLIDLQLSLVFGVNASPTLAATVNR